MKTILLSLVMAIVATASANAEVVTTSSKAPNAAFPKTAAEILGFNKNAKKAAKAISGDEFGDLLGYECQAETDPSIAYTKCTFKHDLPEGMCWYGVFYINYSEAADGTVSVSEKWARE